MEPLTIWVIVAAMVAAGIACWWFAVLAYAGRWRPWIDQRGRTGVSGWIPVGLPVVGLGIILLAAALAIWAAGDPALMYWASPWLSITGFGAVSLGLFLVFVRAPEFLLPAWIRERLDHGDPVVTSRPLEQIQPYLQHPLNQPPVPGPPPDPRGELEFPGDRQRYVILAIVSAAGVVYSALMFWALVLSGASSDLRLPGVGAMILVPMTAYSLLVCVRRAIRPPSALLNPAGLHGPGWSLRWEEVIAVAPAEETEHKSQVVLHVVPGALARVQKPSRKTGGSRIHMRRPEPFIRMPIRLATDRDEQLAALRAFHQHYAPAQYASGGSEAPPHAPFSQDPRHQYGRPDQ